MKGMFFGKYNQVSGKICQMTGKPDQDKKGKGQTLFTLTGDWMNKLEIKDERKKPTLNVC